LLWRGGTILPGCIGNQKLDLVSIFEAVGARSAGKISDGELEQVESCAIPGPGSCGGMYTANTMASAIEALAVGGFARWLIEEKRLLRRNPARHVSLPAQPLLAPRELTPDQRYVLRGLVERADDRRGEALFALGYWAGCRVSDVAWLRFEDVHLGPKVGWIHVGHKGGKERDLDLLNAVRKPLYEEKTRNVI
jgi:site-specific recombinase XerC